MWKEEEESGVIASFPTWRAVKSPVKTRTARWGERVHGKDLSCGYLELEAPADSGVLVGIYQLALRREACLCVGAAYKLCRYKGCAAPN